MDPEFIVGIQYETYTDKDDKPTPEQVRLIYTQKYTHSITEDDIWWGPTWSHFNEFNTNIRRLMLEYKEFPFNMSTYPNHVYSINRNDIKSTRVLDPLILYCCNDAQDIVYGIGTPCMGNCGFANYCQIGQSHSFRINFNNNGEILYEDICENLKPQLDAKLDARFVGFENKTLMMITNIH